MGILANGWAAWIFLVLGLCSIIAILILVLERKWLLAIAPGVLLLISIFGWHYASTHRIVPVNERWVVENKIEARVIGETRSSGIIQKPILGYKFHKFPGVPEKEFCVTYYPALTEGYELETIVCGVYDAANTDWASFYKRYGFSGEEQMFNYWANQSKELVSEALIEVDYTTIVTKRLTVSNSIRMALNPWFRDFGVSVSSLKLKNWDFTSDEVKKQVDAASAASMRKTVEEQLLAAAKIARERQQYEIETANLILKERGTGLDELFSELGITTDSAKAELAGQMTWYTLAANPPEGVQIILSVGGGNTPISIPLPQQNPEPVVTEEPAE